MSNTISTGTSSGAPLPGDSAGIPSDLEDLLIVLSKQAPGTVSIQPALVKESVFVTIVWTGTAISFLFVTARIIVRLQTLGRLWFDDLFVVIGWLSILTSAIVWHYAEKHMYITTAILSGQLSPLAYPNYIPETEHYLKLIVGITVLFYSSLAAIKISFLLFFHRLLSGVRIKAMMVQWWVIFGITLATWIASIGNIPYKCLVRPFTHIVQDCTGHWAISFQRITLSVNCAMDVVTDALIITIPVALLWNVRIATNHRLALAGLFGLTVITMIFAIVRVAVVLSAPGQPDASWLHMWSSIEPPIAVIISCLISFRTLFGPSTVKARPTGPYFGTDNPSFLSNSWTRHLGHGKSGSIALKDISQEEIHRSGNNRPECYMTASGEEILHRDEARNPHVMVYHV